MCFMFGVSRLKGASSEDSPSMTTAIAQNDRRTMDTHTKSSGQDASRSVRDRLVMAGSFESIIRRVT